jgi:DUF3102 family protein
MSTLTTTNDTGPVTDSPAVVGYGELSAVELAKRINDEYGHVLVSERHNLKRAKDIGEKLAALQTRVKHGEWQKKLEVWCPKLSYETARRYIRVFEEWSDIEKKAAAKSVRTTDLTIDTALALLRKPKPEKDTDKEKDSDGNPLTSASATLGAVEPPEPPLADQDEKAEWLKNLAVDELITVLRQECGEEYLQELSAALAKEFPMPPPQPDEAAGVEPMLAELAAQQEGGEFKRRM